MDEDLTFEQEGKSTRVFMGGEPVGTIHVVNSHNGGGTEFVSDLLTLQGFQVDQLAEKMEEITEKHFS